MSHYGTLPVLRNITALRRALFSIRLLVRILPTMMCYQQAFSTTQKGTHTIKDPIVRMIRMLTLKQLLLNILNIVKHYTAATTSSTPSTTLLILLFSNIPSDLLEALCLRIGTTSRSLMTLSISPMNYIEILASDSTTLLSFRKSYRDKAEIHCPLIKYNLSARLPVITYHSSYFSLSFYFLFPSLGSFY